MKALLPVVVSAVLLTACGGAPESAEAPTQPTASADFTPVVMSGDQAEGEVNAQWTANCVSWDSGGRICSFKCTSGSRWFYSLERLSYGQCTPLANAFCGHEAYRVCWSSNPPP